MLSNSQSQSAPPSWPHHKQSPVPPLRTAPHSASPQPIRCGSSRMRRFQKSTAIYTLPANRPDRGRRRSVAVTTTATTTSATHRLQHQHRPPRAHHRHRALQRHRPVRKNMQVVYLDLLFISDATVTGRCHRQTNDGTCRLCRLHRQSVCKCTRKSDNNITTL